MKNSNFSIYEQLKTTNQPIQIVYKPVDTVTSYSYLIYKDESLYDEGKNNRTPKTFTFKETGNYQIVVTNRFKNGTTSEEKSGIYKIDTDKPYILLNEGEYLEIAQLKKDETFELNWLSSSVQVYDKQDGDIFSSLQCDVKMVDFTKTGIQKMTCSVEDSAGNLTTKDLIFNVTKNNTMQLNVIMMMIIVFLFTIIFFLLRYQKAVFLEKKLAKYSIDPIYDKRPTYFEIWMKTYYRFAKKLNHGLEKSGFITKFAHRYDKYTCLYSKHYVSGMDFVSTKVMIAFIFVLISIFSNAIQYKVANLYELLLPMLFGFFLPDFIYLFQYKVYRSKLENDLLQAIIIMNNAFKSGRSITQAVELVTNELDGPIGLEFKKMQLEISFGLSIETVFNRFAERVNLEEVTYLTASLSILNQTGGNIIKVFSSIEKTLFNKKKLKIELNSLTGSSKIIVYALFAVPFLFIVFISLISPNYFEPFYTTPIGIMLLSIMIILYIVYMLVVRKVMKVRM